MAIKTKPLQHELGDTKGLDNVAILSSTSSSSPCTRPTASAASLASWPGQLAQSGQPGWPAWPAELARQPGQKYMAGRRSKHKKSMAMSQLFARSAKAYNRALHLNSMFLFFCWVGIRRPCKAHLGTAKHPSEAQDSLPASSAAEWTATQQPFSPADNPMT
jgi:hypothetical protein